MARRHDNFVLCAYDDFADGPMSLITFMTGFIDPTQCCLWVTGLSFPSGDYAEHFI